MFVFIFESNLAFEAQHLLHAVQNYRDEQGRGIGNWVSLSEGQQQAHGWLTTNERKVRASSLEYIVDVGQRAIMEDRDESERWVEVSPQLSISSLGRVRTYNRVHGHREYTPETDNGHGYVVFKHDGKSHRFNRLVCATFHGPPSPHAYADHINRITTDNRACNLRWASPATNYENSARPVRRCLAEATESQNPIQGERWAELGNFHVSTEGRAQVLRSNYSSAGKWHPIFTPKPQGKSAYARLGKNLFHRMVAQAFLPDPESSTCTVDHINQDKTDNRLVNLRWSSKQQQVANRTIQKKATCLGAKVMVKPVGSAEWETFTGYAVAARVLRERYGLPFHHVNVSRATRSGKPYNGVLFVRA